MILQRMRPWRGAATTAATSLQTYTAERRKNGPAPAPSIRDAETGFALCDERATSTTLYFRLRALLATPPPADFTQTEVGARLVLPRNAQVPPLTGVVAMSAPGQVAPAAAPL